MKHGTIATLMVAACLSVQANAQDVKEDAPRAKMPSFTEPAMEADNRRHMQKYERQKRADQKKATEKACKEKPEACKPQKK